MIHKRYFEEAARQEKLLAAPNRKTDFYNGIFERYENPVLTREHVPLTWRYDLNAETPEPFILITNTAWLPGSKEMTGNPFLA